MSIKTVKCEYLKWKIWLMEEFLQQFQTVI